MKPVEDKFFQRIMDERYQSLLIIGCYSTLYSINWLGDSNASFKVKYVAIKTNKSELFWAQIEHLIARKNPKYNQRNPCENQEIMPIGATLSSL